MFRLTLALLIALATPALAETREVRLGDRSYLIDLPPRASGAPMILVLHGGGGNPGQIANHSGMSRVANPQGYAVIYPAGTGRTRLLTWDAVYCCGYAQRERVDDLAFLDSVIADAARRFGLNAGRVYLTGMSNGSMMAETYAASRPGRVKAVAGVSGTMDVDRVRVRGPVPLLHIHGTEDPMVPYNGGQGDSSLTRTDFASVDEVIAAFRRANGRLSESSRVIDPARDGMRVIETNWSRGGQTRVRLMTVEGGSHVWPGGRARPRQGGTRDIVANEEILRFFAQFP